MVCKPKNVGGLGLCDPLDTKKAMGAKIWWKWIMYENEPWENIWNAKYSHHWPKQMLIRFGEDLPGSSIWKLAQKIVTSSKDTVFGR